MKALAVILVMQQWSGRSPAEFDFNDLRSQLGLPTLGPIEPQPGEIRSLPLVRLARVQVEKLSDDDLVLAFHRAGLYHAWDAARKFARAVIDRPVFARRPERMEAYRLLAQSATTLEEGLASIDEGRRDALANGQSCAVWDLMELSFRFGHGDDIEQAMRLIAAHRVATYPGAGRGPDLDADADQCGLLNPDGTPATAPGSRVRVPGRGRGCPAGCRALEALDPRQRIPRFRRQTLDTGGVNSKSQMRNLKQIPSSELRIEHSKQTRI